MQRIAWSPLNPILELHAAGRADLRDAVLVVDAEHDPWGSAFMQAGEDGDGGVVMPVRLTTVPVRTDRIKDVGLGEAEGPGQVGCARLRLTRLGDRLGINAIR